MTKTFDFAPYEILSFDCYGTLIDWESGILRALRTLLGEAAAGVEDDALLTHYAHFEARFEAGPFQPYRTVLAQVAQAMAGELGVAVEASDADRFAASLGDWPPFPDTVAALRRLGERFRLAIVSNVDDDLFALTAARLEVSFAPVVTARQVGAYKPAHAMFEAAEAQIGVPKECWLHVAQSLVHDIVPARTLGIDCVWVDRRAGRGGGAAGDVEPGQARPDFTVPDLRTLAELALV